MRILYDKFIELFLREFMDLQLGYTYNEERITQLRELMYLIYLLENKKMPREEAISIIELFI